MVSLLEELKRASKIGFVSGYDRKIRVLFRCPFHSISPQPNTSSPLVISIVAAILKGDTNCLAQHRGEQGGEIHVGRMFSG